MLRQMERSILSGSPRLRPDPLKHLLAKRGKSQRAIARELGISRITVARVLEEPVDRHPASRHRPSMVDPYRAQIEQWLQDGLSIVRMFELARADEDQPFRGGRSTFNDRVGRVG